jgi:hypothetical protein
MASRSLLEGMTEPGLRVHSLPVCGASNRGSWSSDRVEQETLNPFPSGSEVPSTAGGATSASNNGMFRHPMSSLS